MVNRLVVVKKLKKENDYFSVFILVIIVEIIATLWFYRV